MPQARPTRLRWPGHRGMAIFYDAKQTGWWIGLLGVAENGGALGPHTGEVVR